MDIFGKVIAVNAQPEPITMSDGRQVSIYDVTLSVPVVRTGQASGTPYVEGQLITASLFLNQGEKCNIYKGLHVAACINITSKFLQEKGRYFNRVNLVRYVDLGGISWAW